MDVTLYAKVTGPSSDPRASLKVSSTSLAEPNGANKTQFENVFDAGAGTSANTALYNSCCSSLVDLLIEGYNVSVVLVTSSKSSAADVINGSNSDGIFYQALENIFNKLDEEQSINRDGNSTLGARKDSSINVSMFEIEKETATDLISSRASMGIEEDSEHGDWLRLAEEKRVYSVAEGKQLFKDSWQRSATFARKDNSDSHYALFAYIDLIMHFESTGQPHKSRYSFIILPSVEGLVQSSEQSTNIKTVETVANDLSTHQHPDRIINYRDSTVTKLIQTELGGNCITKVIACFSPLTDLRLQRPFLKFCKTLGQVKNYPIMNDHYAQQLLTQYRANVIYYRNLPPPPAHEAPVPPSSIPAPVVRMVTPPHQIRYIPDQSRYQDTRLLDQVERLQLKLEQLNSKFSIMANSKAELSAQLVDCEEEKLKATKSYIDMQIQNNKLREEMESNNYELTNKILKLEHDLQLSEMEREKFGKEVSNMRHQLTQLDNDRRSLADEYISLKTNYMSLTDDCEREVAKNDELTMELLNLINAKSVLLQQTKSHKFKDEASALAREEERIRALVHRLSHGGITMDRLRPDHRRKDLMEKELFGNSSRYQDRMNKMHEEYSEGRQQLQIKVEVMEKELASSRSLVRERQQKISFLNARLITLGGDNSELQTVNNRLQHKIKDINSEYRLRLTKYVEDIASHIDSVGDHKEDHKGEESLAQYVNKMIKDVKAAHRSREDQLSQAAQSYKNRLQSVVKRHEELLCAYRDLRAQVEAMGLDDLDLGPDERELILSDADLQSSQQREIVRLQSALHNLKINNKADEKAAKDDGGSPRHPSSTFTDLDSWTSVRKQLRHFSEQSLRELEEERASLMTKNIILEEQLKESQDYIDKHLARYKEEITRLRQQLSYQNRS